MKYKKGVLIVHGFGGCRQEVLPLAQYLEERGLLVSVPLLPGHGNGRKDMGLAVRGQWLRTVGQAYEVLADQCERVYVVGFSMGGLLSIRLLTEGLPAELRRRDQLEGLVTVNTPVYYWNPRQILLNALRGDERSVLRRNRRTAGAYPLRAMWEFQMLLSETKGHFRRIQCPALIVQTADDDTVWPCSGDYLLRRMAGERRMVKLPRGGHQIFQSSAAGDAFRAIGAFMGL